MVRNKDDLPHCRVIMGVFGAIQAICEFCLLEGPHTFQRSKLINRVKRPRNIQNAQEHNDNCYFFILDHFQAIYEVELNSHTKS